MSNTQIAVNAPAPGNSDNVEAPDKSVPEKLQGKDLHELAEMYTQLEKRFGEQRNEVGALRQQLTEVTQAPREPQEDVDFYSDPDRYVQLQVQPLAEEITNLRVELMRGKLERAHPEYQETIQDSEFQKWVGDSQVRLQQWQQADRGDWNSANELFSTWKELKGSEKTRQKQEQDAVKRDRKLRAATTEKGAAGLPPGKRFKASDLQALRRNNPERYRELGPEIMKAYAEGRVDRE